MEEDAKEERQIGTVPYCPIPFGPDRTSSQVRSSPGAEGCQLLV